MLVFGSLTLTLLVSIALAAGDPWKTKPFQQWDEKDIKKILSDSPWSKSAQIPAHWSAGGDSAPGMSQASPSASQAQPTLGGGGTYPTANAPKAPEASSGMFQVSFLVRWISSRTIRRALLRAGVLGGRMTQDEADKQAAQPSEVYKVLIVGQDMKPFQGADDKALLEKTYLMTKKTKQRIPAVGVEYQRGPDGKTIQAAALSFPKKSANGEATISPDEKGVEFFCSVGGANIRASFEPPKMEDSLGRDL